MLEKKLRISLHFWKNLGH